MDKYTQLKNSIKLIQRKKDAHYSIIYSIIGFLLQLPISMGLLGLSIYWISHDITNNDLTLWKVWIAVLLFSIWLIFPLKILTGIYQDYKITKTVSLLVELNNLFQNTENRIDTIDDILTGIEKINTLLPDLKFLLKYAYSKDSVYLFLKKKSLEYFLFVLYNLRNDLQNNIINISKALESGKWEVEKNIKWTSELDKVAELQKVRLDRQIEQFEELQKILVKA